MDEEVMIAWVNMVLASYVPMAPDHVLLILILDMYQCRMVALVVQMIHQELGMEVQHIPGGCRYYHWYVQISIGNEFWGPLN